MKHHLRIALRASATMGSAIALAVAGQASAKEPVAANAGVAASKQSTQADGSKRATTQYCMTVEALTGSRMPKRKCKTIAEWEALGYSFKADR